MSQMPNEPTISRTITAFARVAIGGGGTGVLIGAMLLEHYDAMTSGALLIATSVALCTWVEITNAK